MLRKLSISFCFALLFVSLPPKIVYGIKIQSVPISSSSEDTVSSSSTVNPLTHNDTKNINKMSSKTESVSINHNKTIAPTVTETPYLLLSTQTTASNSVSSLPQLTNSSDSPITKQNLDHSSEDKTKIINTVTSTPSSNYSLDHSMEKAKLNTDSPKSKNIKSDFVTESKPKQPIESTTTAAGIVAFVCVGIASSAFLALMAWRYIYKKRHGNREILINEEDVDFNDEDLRHFEATCIQLEPDS